MAARQAIPATKWIAKADVEVRNLCISTIRTDEARGRQKIRKITIPALKDGVYYFDIGRRSKAMLLQQLKMLKSSTFVDDIKLGVWSESLPNPGEIPIAKTSQIKGTKERNITYDSDVELQVPDGLDNPHVYTVVGNGSIGYQYKIPEQIEMSFVVTSVARKFAPEMLEEILRESPWHIGDHSSQGFGAGKLVGFKILEEPRKFKTL